MCNAMQNSERWERKGKKKRLLVAQRIYGKVFKGGGGSKSFLCLYVKDRDGPSLRPKR